MASNLTHAIIHVCKISWYVAYGEILLYEKTLVLVIYNFTDNRVLFPPYNWTFVLADILSKLHWVGLTDANIQIKWDDVFYLFRTQA